MGNIVEALLELETPKLIGATLSNNATVIKATYIHGYTFVVLAVREHNLHPFVVWNMDWHEDKLEPYKGTYCATLDEAVEAYLLRGGNE